MFEKIIDFFIPFLDSDVSNDIPNASRTEYWPSSSIDEKEQILYMIVDPSLTIIKMSLNSYKRERLTSYASMKCIVLEIDGEIPVGIDSEIFAEWKGMIPAVNAQEALVLKLLERFGITGRLKMISESMAVNQARVNKLMKQIKKGGE